MYVVCQYEVVDGFTALGIPKLAVTLSLTRKLLYLTLTVVLPIFLGAAGAFYAEPAVDILCGLASITVYALVIGRILREREIVHYQRFGEGLRLVQEKLDSRNFYAFNPEFDNKGCR